MKSRRLKRSFNSQLSLNQTKRSHSFPWVYDENFLGEPLAVLKPSAMDQATRVLVLI